MSLGFFSAEDASSSSDSEAEDKSTKPEEVKKPCGVEEDRLPSPKTLFATVGRPAFLNESSRPFVDWDKYAKRPDPPDEENSHERGHYAAIPPPSSGSEVSAAPVKYSPPPGSPDNVSATFDDGPSTGKIPDLAPSVDGSSKKKQKVETFRQKEKKKRDFGMSSRGKNYVEEEKRVLKQQYGTHAGD